MELAFNCAWFELVILDHDRLEFSFTGPMSNDTATTQNIVERGHAGRHFSIDGPVSNVLNRDQFIALVSQRSGYSYVVNGFAKNSLARKSKVDIPAPI